MTKPSSTPIELAEATGAKAKNPARFKTPRGGIASPSLGDPPQHFEADERRAWLKFKRECPWLQEADRAITELATIVRVKIERREANQFHYAQYRSLLVQLSATPASRGGAKSAPSEPERLPPHFFS